MEAQGHVQVSAGPLKSSGLMLLQWRQPEPEGEKSDERKPARGEETAVLFCFISRIRTMRAPRRKKNLISA